MQSHGTQKNIRIEYLEKRYGMINANNRSITVPNLGDHRICMSSFILAILTGVKTNIKNFETVFTSSPSFLKIMKKLGAKFEIKKIS